MTDSVKERMEGLDRWLAEQPVDPRKEQAHLQDGSKERLYWHAGYLSALKDLSEYLGLWKPRQ